MARRVGVVGTGQSKYKDRRNDVNTPELVREAAMAAMNDAGITPRDIDACVIAGAPDLLEEISFSENWIGPAIGASGKPLVRVHAGINVGANATVSAFFQVAAGAFDVVLAVSYNQCTIEDFQCNSMDCCDPLWDLGFECPQSTLAGLQAQFYLSRHEGKVTEEHGAMIAVKNRKNAILNPYAHIRSEITVEEVMNSPEVASPIKVLDCSSVCDGAAAIIVAEEMKARKLNPAPAWISGLGACSESRSVPYVDMAYPESCVRAAQQAYQMAWVYEPASDLDIAEVHDTFSFQELIWCEALGICEPGTAGKFLELGGSMFDGELPVNPSGGVISTNPEGASSMVRQIEAANQIMGKAGDHQVPGARRALAHAWGGAIQYSVVMVFSSGF
ncbi:MAG: thiolase domain-containing protein [Actinobacteria bacterium]|nr:thiolase domain-containing protein [Actinomycetota bacterium]